MPRSFEDDVSEALNSIAIQAGAGAKVGATKFHRGRVLKFIPRGALQKHVDGVAFASIVLAVREISATANDTSRPLHRRIDAMFLSKTNTLYNSWEDEEDNSAVTPGVPLNMSVQPSANLPEIEFTFSTAVRNVNAPQTSLEAWYFVSKTLGYLQVWRENETLLGAPAGPLKDFGLPVFESHRRVSLGHPSYQLFEHGLITYSPDSGHRTVTGNFRDEYMNHGGLLLLGAARTNVIPLTFRHNSDKIEELHVQYFENGQLLQDSNGRVHAISDRGYLIQPIAHPSFPFMQIRTSLDQIIVHEESGPDNFFGFGAEDHLKLKLVHSHGAGDTYQSRVTSVDMQADDERTYNVNLEIYSGSLLGCSTLDLFGVEDDNADDAKVALDAFLNAVEEEGRGGGELREYYDRIRIDYPGIQFGALAMTFTVGFILTATVVALATGATVAVSLGGAAAGASIGISIAGGSSLGGPIGIAVGALAATIAVAFVASEPPDALMLGSYKLLGIDILDAFSGPLTTTVTALPMIELVLDHAYRIHTQKTIEKDGEDIVERYLFTTQTPGPRTLPGTRPFSGGPGGLIVLPEHWVEFSKYELVFRHSRI